MIAFAIYKKYCEQQINENFSARSSPPFVDTYYLGNR